MEKKSVNSHDKCNHISGYSAAFSTCGRFRLPELSVSFFARVRKNLYTLSVLFLLPFVGAAQQSLSQQKDSLRQAITLSEGVEKLKSYSRLAGLYLQDIEQEHVIDTIFAIYDEMDDEARQQGKPGYQGLARANKLNALSNKDLNDEIIRLAPEYLDFFAANKLWGQYGQVYSFVIGAYRRKGEYEQAHREAQALYEHAKERQDAGTMGVAFYAMSRIYSYQRRFAEREKCLRQAMALLQDSTAYLNVLANIYTDLGFNLVAQQRYDEALQIAAESEDVNRRYEEASKTRQTTAWRNTWGVYLDAYRQSGVFDKAEVYLNKIDSLTHGNALQYEERAHILRGRNQYAEALEMINKAIETATVNGQISAKGFKLDILIRLCEADSAALLYREIIADLDARNNRDFTAQLDELRTQYEVEEHIAGKERNRNYFLFALAGCALLTIALGIWIFLNRRLARTNRELVRKNQEWANVAPPPTEDTDEEIAAKTTLSAAPDEVDRAIMAEIEKWVAGGLYRDCNLSLNTLAEKIKQNPTYISKAVSHCTGKNFKTYINDYRIKESIRILSDKSSANLSVEDLAFESGFNDRVTFYRVFRKTTGLSPADFKKNVRHE